jgi:hypothetical protein
MKIVFLFLLIVPVIAFTQPRLLECNCQENAFRQTWEIDTINQKIRHVSSLNLADGEFFSVNENFDKNVIWNNNFICFLYEEAGEFDPVPSAYFYRFDLINNAFISEIYDGGDGSLFRQEYQCLWLK